MSPSVRATRCVKSDVIGIVAFALLMPAAVDLSSAQGSPGAIRRAQRAVQGRYIVRVRSAADPDALASMSQALGRGRVRHVYRHAYRGFAIQASEAVARALSSDPAVAYVEEDAVVRATGAQALHDEDNWGLDRIDQRVITRNGAAAYDHSYRYSAEGTGVNVYVVDTGVRTTHVEFGGRAFAAFDARAYEGVTGDCHGHGTHLAGIVGGLRFGVAKSVTLHSVRVLGCEGAGLVSELLAGIDWITSHHVRPAVINMSIGAGASDAFDESARAALAAGITFVAAAGNDSADACDGLVGGVPGLVVVGASGSSDAREPYSNYGRCVDLFAPGGDVLSAYAVSDEARTFMSGTSMASPHVAGAATLYLQQHPAATPAQVATALTGSATGGVVLDAGIGSPNRLLFTPHFGDTTPPTISAIELAPGATVRGIHALRVSAEDDIEMASVTVSACRSHVGTATVAPYSIQWNTTTSPDGECAVEIQAYDLAGNVASTRRSVIIQNRKDVIAPQLTLSAQPGQIWPANGKLVPVTFTGTVSDIVASIATVSFRTTDEYGRVQPTGTVPVTNGRFQITVRLEALRYGRDRDGREYVMMVQATDPAGNHTTTRANAIVSHDRGH